VQAKYPIAKALLHLMGAYLCENVNVDEANVDECGRDHRNAAYNQLKKLDVQK
jgi:hypothetical protein